MITKGEALISLRPGAAWKLNGDEVIWLDENQTQPTESEITESEMGKSIVYSNNPLLYENHLGET